MRARIIRRSRQSTAPNADGRSGQHGERGEHERQIEIAVAILQTGRRCLNSSRRTRRPRRRKRERHRHLEPRRTATAAHGRKMRRRSTAGGRHRARRSSMSFDVFEPGHVDPTRKESSMHARDIGNDAEAEQTTNSGADGDLRNACRKHHEGYTEAFTVRGISDHQRIAMPKHDERRRRRALVRRDQGYPARVAATRRSIGGPPSSELE